VNSRTFKVISKVKKYETPWMIVEDYTIDRDGKTGQYGVVKRANGVSIVARTTDGRILFVKQFRFPTESYGWEIPMGAIDAGEQPLEAAARELLEETGLDTPVSQIVTYHPVPGLSPSTMSVFQTTIPDESVSGVELFDAVMDEIVERRLLTPKAIKAMLRSGEISDGYTITALALVDQLGE
jgi:8-oxo-dGTP pyrophosphatase MutT (NUDIX family)